MTIYIQSDFDNEEVLSLFSTIAVDLKDEWTIVVLEYINKHFPDFSNAWLLPCEMVSHGTCPLWKPLWVTILSPVFCC